MSDWENAMQGQWEHAMFEEQRDVEYIFALEAERDELKAEVERLKHDVSRLEAEMNLARGTVDVAIHERDELKQQLASADDHTIKLESSLCTVGQERDKLKEEVEKLKGLALSSSMDAAELSEQLVAHREGSDQNLFDMVVRFFATPDNLLRAAYTFNEYRKLGVVANNENIQDYLRQHAKIFCLSTAVLDELWPEGDYTNG